MVAIDPTKVQAASDDARDAVSRDLGEAFAQVQSAVEGARTLDEAAAIIAAVRNGVRPVADAAVTGGAGAVLALASGTTASAPAATPVAVVDPRLEAIASNLGRTPDEALSLLEQMVQAIGSPVTGAAPAAARGIAAEGAFKGRVTVREDSSPPGTVLSNGAVSTGPAPVTLLSAPSGVSQADHDAIKADRDAIKADRDAIKAGRDAALSRNTAFEAARTALMAALAMPDGRRERPAREAAVQQALGQLNAV